jgi:hypothetical protein
MPTYVRDAGAWKAVSGGITTITVTQSGYTGTSPITTSGNTISIASTSNSYGTRYIQTYTPTTEGHNGAPLEPGKWLIPAHATDIEPPTCESNQIQVFNGKSWDIIEDQRGIYYSTKTREVIENDNPLETPENATKEVPPEVPEGYILTWNDEWVLEELPPPPVLTAEEKLQQSGLTVEELKELLGLS